MFFSPKHKCRPRHHFRYTSIHHHHQHFLVKPSENPIKDNSSLSYHYPGNPSNYKHSLGLCSGPLRNSVGILTLSFNLYVTPKSLAHIDCTCSSSSFPHGQPFPKTPFCPVPRFQSSLFLPSPHLWYSVLSGVTV